MTAEAPKFGWGHININVSNLEDAIGFYQKLGFEMFIPGIPYLGLTADPDHSAMPATATDALGITTGTRGRACIMQLGRGFPKIDLTELADTVQTAPATNADLGLVRFCLASPNLQRDVDLLRAQGVQFLTPAQTTPGGLAEIATCMDPDGTLIELLQVHLDKWPTINRNSPSTT
jgi:catechol 2,3-dioxygenase-like lactoylglutathione lyase family enzyme